MRSFLPAPLLTFASLALWLQVAPSVDAQESIPATNAFRATLTVAAAAGGGDFQTVQAAVDAVPADNTRPVTIFIKPGTYKERLTVPLNKPFITLRGEDAETTLITFDLNARDTGPDAKSPGPNGTKEYGTSGCSSVFIDANDFSAENVSFENSSGNRGQAPAINITGERASFRRCRFLGWQDTVYLKKGRQFFEDCYIAGGVDYIFGAGIVYFDRCHLHCRASGFITAASTAPEAGQGYVFSHCRITADTGPNSVFLGRPWRPYSSVAYLHTEMSEAIRSAGWDNWRDPARERTVRYAEYGNFGPGADPAGRVAWAKKLTEAEALALTPERVLGGTDGWNPKRRYAADAPLPVIAQPSVPERVFDISDYGALGDGKTLNAAALARAIEACRVAGGGTVRVPKGQFLTGPIRFVDHMNLRVEAGGILLFSNNPEDFSLRRGRYVDAISAEGCQDIAITGHGAIDGQGQPWWEPYRKRRPGQPPPEIPPDQLPHRPHLIVLNDCRRVLLQDISLRNSPMFHFVPQHCEDVTVDGIHVNAPPDAPNTDGMDPSGRNYLITRSFFDTGDDNIAFKPSYAKGEPHTDQPACENFTVADCVFLHGHGLSIGGQTPGGMRHLLVRDCRFDGTQAGIRMKANRGSGGPVEGLVYENLTMQNVKVAILITSYYPTIPAAPEKDAAQSVSPLTPIWRDVQIRHVTAAGGATAGRIIGLPEMDVSNVTLTDVNFSADRGFDVIHAKGIRFVDSQIEAKRGAPLMVKEADVTGIEIPPPVSPVAPSPAPETLDKQLPADAASPSAAPSI